MRDQPRWWLENREWRSGVMTRRGDGGLGNLIGWLAFAAVCGGFGYLIRTEDRGAFPLALLFAIAVAGFAFKSYFTAFRIGATTFTFDRLPFILGQTLTGTIKVTNLEAVSGTRVRLCCEEGDDSGSSFHAVHPIRPETVRYVPGGAELDVSFDLPREGRASREQGFSVSWELSIITGFPGGVALVTFRVPVCGPDAAPDVQKTAIGAARWRALDRGIALFR